MKLSYLPLLLVVAAPAHAAPSATLEDMTASLLRRSSTFQTYMKANLPQFQNYSIELPSSLGRAYSQAVDGKTGLALGGSLSEWDAQGRPTGSFENFDLRITKAGEKFGIELRMANESVQPPKIMAMQSRNNLFENYDSLAGYVEGTIPNADAQKEGACAETIRKASDARQIRSAFECEGDNNLSVSWTNLAETPQSIPTQSCVVITDDSMIVSGRSQTKNGEAAAEFLKLSLKDATNSGGPDSDDYVRALRFSPQGDLLSWSAKNLEEMCGYDDSTFDKILGQHNYGCAAYMDVNVTFSAKTGDLKISTQPKKYSFFHALPAEFKPSLLTKTCHEVRLP